MNKNIGLVRSSDRKLFVTDIPPTISHSDVKETFSQYGKIVDCILKPKGTKVKSYAFVTYSTVEEAMRARIAAYLCLICFENQQVKVKPANPWHQPDSIKVQDTVEEIIINRSYVFVHHDNHNDVVMEEDADETSIQRLNDHCLMHIFQYLTIADRVRCERVCQRWLEVSRESWSLCRSLSISPSTWWPPQAEDIANNQPSQLHDRPITTSILHRVLRRHGRYLLRLDLSGGRLIVHGNSVLSTLSQYCPNVQVVDLGPLEVTDIGLRAFSQHCRKLKSFTLRLKYSGRVSDDCLAKVFARNPGIQSLDLYVSSNNTFEGRCLMHLPKESLEHLTLSGETSVDLIVHLHKVVARMERLHTLRLNLVNQAFEGAELVSFLPLRVETLKVLEIPHSKAYYSDITPILKLKNLEKLNIADCTLVDDNFLIQLARMCECLTDLDISSCVHVGNNGLWSLSILPNLNRLRASHLPLITEVMLTDLTRLRQLDVSACPNLWSARGLCHLLETRHGQLELLDVSECGPRVCVEVIVVAKRVAERRQSHLTIRASNSGLTMAHEEASRYLKVITRNW